MNLLEQYLEPGYKVTVLKDKDSPIKGVTCVRYDGKVDCYGDIQQVQKIFTLKEWHQVKKQGYYMA